MQEALFYGFSLGRHVPSDHMLRKIDRFVDLSGIRAHLEPYYSDVGRPSIDPELMIRMLLVGYCYGIRSERRLSDEVHLNLAYRWFCRLGLDGGVPDHSTFSKNRHGRFRDSDLLRHLFETVVARCMSEGLVGGEAFAVDASMVVADAHRRRGVASSAALAPASNRAVAEYLAKSERTDGTFSRADFAYDQENDAYVCPAGKPLRKYRRPFAMPRIGVTKDNTVLYRASKFDCDACALKVQCCPNAPARKVPRSIHEAARDKARAIAKTEAYIVSRRERKKVEMLFTHLKRILRLDRLRLRGPSGAHDEFLLAATAQNLRRLAKLSPLPQPVMAS